jgi:secreted trypsin-like serine protease
VATRALLAAVLLTLALAASALGSPPPRASSSIVGGQDADIADWPSIAFILTAWDTDGDPTDLEESARCTGTVIAPQWVISAAHCAFQPDGQPIDALLTITGVGDFRDPDREVIAADGLAVHPAWDPDFLIGDALLIHLESASSAPPLLVVHPDGDYFSPPDTVNAAGWGDVDEESTIGTAVLQEAWLEIHDDDFCAEFATHIETQTCAGTLTKAGACRGDSGGPLLVFDDDGRPVLYGLTSYGPQIGLGLPICSLQAPAVFSWLPAFTPFICDTIDPCPLHTRTPTPNPTPPTTPPGGGTTVIPPAPIASAPDAIAPVLSRVRLSKARVRVGRRVTLSFRLSEAAAVTVTVLKKKGRRYRALSPRMQLAADAGTTRRRFDGRLGKRRLKPGRYKFSLRAVDAAGNVARAVTVRFRMVR